jgi:hypothetical protein
LGGGDGQQALPAVAFHHNLAILAPFQNSTKAVQAQPAFWPFLAVAAQARGLEHGPDIIGVSDAFLGRCRRQLADIDLAEVQFFLGSNRAHGSGEPEK